MNGRLFVNLPFFYVKMLVFQKARCFAIVKNYFRGTLYTGLQKEYY